MDIYVLKGTSIPCGKYTLTNTGSTLIEPNEYLQYN